VPVSRSALASVAGVTVVVTAVALVATALVGHGPTEQGELARGVVAGVAYGALGGVVARRRPELVLGWLMLLVGASSALSVACDTYARHSLTVEGSPLPAGELAYWLSTWTWTPGYMLPATLLLLLFPTGAPPTPRWRPLVWGTVATIVVATAGWALTPYADQDFAPPAELGPVSSPFHIEGADLLLIIALPAFLLCALLSLASVVVRWRRATAAERDQLQWILVAGVIFLCIIGIGLSMPTYVPGFVAVALAPLPVAITLGILRRGLWQLDLALNRSLVYGGLTLAVVLLYAVVVAAAGRALGEVTDDQKIVAVVIAAIAAQPLRDRLQRGVNRLLYGDRDDPAVAVQRLTDRLDAATHPADVLPALAETVARTLRLPYAAVELPGRPTVAHGRQTGEAIEVPLVHQGRDVGTLSVCARPGETGLGTRERALLDRLAREAAVAAHAVALQADLQVSRERLVLSREEERKRLRRDLHDDLGPVLAATAMKLEATRESLRDDPEAAIRSLDAATATLRDSVAGVRRIVDDLRPPSLDGLGLVGALREQLDQFGDAGVRLELDVRAPVDRLAGLPAAVDVAAYRIASEAVTNALRHGSPSRVELVLDVADGQLVVCVADDGAGVDDEVTAGVGLESMHARAAELGGSCTLDSRAGGGTVVSARLPLEPLMEER
jgi:signal transduction histidine kinase